MGTYTYEVPSLYVAPRERRHTMPASPLAASPSRDGKWSRFTQTSETLTVLAQGKAIEGKKSSCQQELPPEEGRSRPFVTQ